MLPAGQMSSIGEYVYGEAQRAFKREFLYSVGGEGSEPSGKVLEEDEGIPFQNSASLPGLFRGWSALSPAFPTPALSSPPALQLPPQQPLFYP